MTEAGSWTYGAVHQMSDFTDTKHLSVLKPSSIGPLTAKNRIAFIATVSNLGRNDAITPEQVAFYEARARGGTALIVTEGMSVHPTSVPSPTVPLAYDRDLIPGLRALAAAVQRHDGLIFSQLWHVGRQALWNPSEQPWSPSGERDPYSGTTPHVMTEDEIREVVAAFAGAAANVREAGFDGVELHGAHGYLITQFLSGYSNRRTDQWGGSIENRSRFVVEVVQAIRARCGDEFPIGLKLTTHEWVDGGLDLAESQRIVDHLLGQVTLDYVAVSQANFGPSLEKHVPDLRFPDVPFEELIAGIHHAVAGRSQVMGLCKVPDAKTASRLIDAGTADLVGMSRALLADPDLVAKVSAGRRPRPCIYCNVCWEHIHTGRPAHCIYAPATGREAEIAELEAAAKPADAPLRILVSGAGPAGLEFARVAARRGHDVEVRDTAAVPGGRFTRTASVEGLGDYQLAADWLAEEAQASGARLTTGFQNDAEGSNADLQVIATGSEPQVDPIDGVVTLSLEDALLQVDHLADPVFVVDEIEAEPVYAAAEVLARAGHEVQVLTRRAALGRRVAYVSMIGVHRRLDNAGIRVHTLLSPERITDGHLLAVHAFSRREHDLGPVGTIVRAGPYVASPAAAPGAGRTLVIGDASAPRDALGVVYEAHRQALSLPVCRDREEVPSTAGTGREPLSHV